MGNFKILIEKLEVFFIFWASSSCTFTVAACRKKKIENAHQKYNLAALCNTT